MPAKALRRPDRGGCSFRVASTQERAELGLHPLAAHRATARVGYLVDVDGAGHVRVLVPEQEGQLIH